MSLRCAPRVWKWSLLGSLCLIVASWANPEISIDLPDGTPMEFIWVEPGTFKMGMTSEQKKGIANHRGVDFASMMPAHRVTISTGFYLGKYEVTQAQWRAVMNRLPDPDVEQNPDLPVLVIDLNDLEQFLFRMSDAMDGGLVRLPTEAEWEYACRAGTTTLWWFGDTEFVGENLRPFMWYHANACRDSGESVKPCYANPVGRKRPNPWGFHDMHGNLEELTADRSLRDYAIYSVTDPMSQEPDPDFGGRVARGGGTAGGNISSAKQLITTSAFRVIQGSGGIRLLLVMPEEGLRASAGGLLPDSPTHSTAQQALASRCPSSGLNTRTTRRSGFCQDVIR